MKKFRLSFIIPVYNEEGSVKFLYEEIKQVAKFLKKQRKVSTYEVIFINDGSRDRTQYILESLKQTEKDKLKIIQFRRNFGKAEAYNAGFELCSGDLIFTMDGDLQDNPQEIPRFIEKIERGYDIIIGWKYRRRDSISKKLASKLFNAIMRSSTRLRLHDFDNGYRCMKKEILPHLHLYEGLYRYIPVFASSRGFKVGEIKVRHRPRRFGKSKYGISRLYRGFFDLITIKFLFFYLKRPLHFFGGIGIFLFSLGILLGLYLLSLILRQINWQRPFLTISILLIIMGIQFILFGLIGEMITNISRKEKNYAIRKIV